MESVIKRSGHIHPGSEKLLKTIKRAINHSNGDKAPFWWENKTWVCYWNFYSDGISYQSSGCYYTLSEKMTHDKINN